MRSIPASLGNPRPSPQSPLRPLVLAVMTSLMPAAAAALSDAERITQLEQRIAVLEKALAAQAATPAPVPAADPALAQTVKILQRKLEIKEEEAAAAAPTTPVVSAGEKGFSIALKDQSFAFKLRGLLHTDVREFLSDDNLPDSVDSFLFRRVRPTIEGTVFGIYDFKFMPDFTGGRAVAVDAYAEARFSPKFKVRVGKFKPPVGLERLQGAADIRFAERALPTNLVPNRDIGIQFSGDVAGGKLNYAIGLFNGVLDGGTSDATADADNNGDKEIAARLFASPFINSPTVGLRGLSLGIAASHTDQTGSASSPLLPSYRTPGQLSAFGYRTGTTATFADGRRLRVSPQFTFYYGSFGALGEYVRVSQEVARSTATGIRRDELDHDSWQTAFSWVLTGEEAAFTGVKPRSPFKLGAPGWGALELVARYSTLELDDDSFTGGAASFADPNTAYAEADAFAVGLNWYFNRNVKWVLDYEQTDFKGGAAAGRDRDDEKVVFGRVQLAF